MNKFLVKWYLVHSKRFAGTHTLFNVFNVDRPVFHTSPLPAKSAHCAAALIEQQLGAAMLHAREFKSLHMLCLTTANYHIKSMQFQTSSTLKGMLMYKMSVSVVVCSFPALVSLSTQPLWPSCITSCITSWLLHLLNYNLQPFSHHPILQY